MAWTEYDDRRHGQGIRRRQGGRSSVYPGGTWYQGSLPWWLYDPEVATEVAEQTAEGIPGSDGSTGAY